MSGIESLDDLDEGALGDLFRQLQLEDLVKASFGGDRSAAGRYAAEQRWKNHRKKEEDAKGRQGGGSLDDEITRATGMLSAVEKLPEYDPDRVIRPEDYDSYSGTKFVYVWGKRGTRYLVVTKQVLEAEAAVNALGKRVAQQLGEELVASGEITPTQLDEALVFMSRDEGAGLDSARDAALERAMSGDATLPEPVREAGQKLKDAQAAAKETKSALIKATRAYNEFRKENDEIRRSGRVLTEEEAQARREMQDELWMERRQAKQNNDMAKGGVRLAEQQLERWVTDFVGSAKVATDFKEVERLKENAVMVQGLIGLKVQSLLASRRDMEGDMPIRGVKTPTEMRNKDGQLIDAHYEAAKIIKQVRQRIPSALTFALNKFGQSIGVRIEFGGSGGSYNETNNLIKSDMDDSDTLTHETVHGISNFSRQTRLVEQAALQRRIFGNPDQPNDSFSEKLKIGLQKIVGATAAMGRSFAGRYIKDKFVNGYQGRLYELEEAELSGFSSKTKTFKGFTEVLTVATENVFGGGHKFRREGKLDLDLMYTALGWLLTAEGGK